MVIELTKIYVVYGIRKGDETNFVELIKAFYIREEADKHCSELLQKEDNPYREILWQETVLEGKTISYSIKHDGIITRVKKCQ